ncbi:MAG: hypothetical protein IJ243_09260 [Prevotella sp.]|nr:hypothetical protein [Prevotella sp.]
MTKRGKKEGLKALIFQKFCARKLLDENERVLSGFGKVLFYSRLRSKWAKKRTGGEKKSTPNFQKALTFENLACLQKRSSMQNFGLILHKKGGLCRIFCKNRRAFTAKSCTNGRKCAGFLRRLKFFFVKKREFSDARVF